MSTGPGPHAPARYELRIAGHLDKHWSAWFGALVLTHEDDGTTALRGTVADQAELHGVLTRVRDLGATLLSVTSDATTRDAGNHADPAGATDATDRRRPRTPAPRHRQPPTSPSTLRRTTARAARTEE